MQTTEEPTCGVMESREAHHRDATTEEDHHLHSFSARFSNRRFRTHSLERPGKSFLAYCSSQRNLHHHGRPRLKAAKPDDASVSMVHADQTKILLEELPSQGRLTIETRWRKTITCISQEAQDSQTDAFAPTRRRRSRDTEKFSHMAHLQSVRRR